MSGGAPRVLLVEDDDLQRFTTGMLLEDRGYRVEAVGSLAAARAALGGEPYDLVMLDVNLGDGLGTSLLPLLRCEHPGTSVALLSGDPRDARREAVELLLVKGGETARMLDRIDEALAARAASLF